MSKEPQRFRVSLDRLVRVPAAGFVAVEMEPSTALLLVNGQTVRLPRRLAIGERLGAQPRPAIVVCRREGTQIGSVDG